MTDRFRNPSLESFFKWEIRVVISAAAFAFVAMSMLFISPVLLGGNPKFIAVTNMTIVSRVVLPLQLALALAIVGTVINALFHLLQSFRRT
jgi:hypothetical protein